MEIRYDPFVFCLREFLWPFHLLTFHFHFTCKIKMTYISLVTPSSPQKKKYFTLFKQGSDHSVMGNLHLILILIFLLFVF